MVSSQAAHATFDPFSFGTLECNACGVRGVGTVITSHRSCEGDPSVSRGAMTSARGNRKGCRQPSIVWAFEVADDPLFDLDSLEQVNPAPHLADFPISAAYVITNRHCGLLSLLLYHAHVQRPHSIFVSQSDF